MKKLLALLLCILVVCTMMSVTCFATEIVDEAPSPSGDVPSQSEISEASEKIIDDIISWVKGHVEEISVIITLLLYTFYNIRRFTKMDKSVGTLNNNAITMAGDSEKAISAALIGIGNVSNELSSIKDNVDKSLGSIVTHLDTSKMATIELANEVAELLVLANIPNAKKEELYARHRAAVDAITSAEAALITEVEGNAEEV